MGIKIEKGEEMKNYVTPEQLGSNATNEDVKSFISFANEWAEKNGYDIEFIAGEGKNSDESIEIGNMAFDAWNDVESKKDTK